MKSLLMILTIVLLMCTIGCENNPVSVPRVQEPPIVQEPDQDLIDFACRMVESNAYQISEIISFSNDFEVTQEDIRTFYVSGECTFIDIHNLVKVGKFICGIRLYYYDRGPFSGFGAHTFQFSTEG